jgi:LmbE family N-acetylglucosaminyl deacetylase
MVEVTRAGYPQAFASAPAEAPAKSKVFLVVVAHPDDENMMGDVLAKFGREGHKVHIIIATDGKDGTRVTSIPAGNGLGALRRRESQCACKKLGVEPPIFLSIDRLDTKYGVRPYLNGRKVLLADLEKHLTAINPDAVFTFGPDGEYGHPEHIVIGAAVTDLLLKRGLVERFPLYYLAWTEEQVQDDADLSYVDPQYLDLKVGYTDEDEEKSFDAARCYATQTTPQEIAELIRGKRADKLNATRFRKLHVRSRQKAAGPGLDEW